MKKIDELRQWCRYKQTFSSVDVRRWGLDNFYISADRMVRKMAENGEIVRISPTEAILRGLSKGSARIAWYTFSPMGFEDKNSYRYGSGQVEPRRNKTGAARANACPPASSTQLEDSLKDANGFF